MWQIQNNSTLKMIERANVYEGLYDLHSFLVFDKDFVPKFVLTYKHVI